MIRAKNCPKCAQSFPRTVEHFYRNKAVGDGLSTYCKSCEKEIRRKYRASPTGRENNAKYYRANKHRFIERQRQSYKKNPLKRLAMTHQYIARKEQLPSTLTSKEWEDIKAAYSYRCAYCGKSWAEIEGVLTQEHVIPVAQGGGYTADNIVPACRSCNSRKHSRTPEEAGMRLRKPDETW